MKGKIFLNKRLYWLLSHSMPVSVVIAGCLALVFPNYQPHYLFVVLLVFNNLLFFFLFNPKSVLSTKTAVFLFITVYSLIAKVYMLVYGIANGVTSSDFLFNELKAVSILMILADIALVGILLTNIVKYFVSKAHGVNQAELNRN